MMEEAKMGNNDLNIKKGNIEVHKKENEKNEVKENKERNVNILHRDINLISNNNNNNNEKININSNANNYNYNYNLGGAKKEPVNPLANNHNNPSNNLLNNNNPALQRPISAKNIHSNPSPNNILSNNNNILDNKYNIGNNNYNNNINNVNKIINRNPSNPVNQMNPVNNNIILNPQSKDVAQLVNNNIQNILQNRNNVQINNLQKQVASRPQSAKVGAPEKNLINQINHVNHINHAQANQANQANQVNLVNNYNHLNRVNPSNNIQDMRKYHDRAVSPLPGRVANNILGNNILNKSPPRSKSPLPQPVNILKRPNSNNVNRDVSPRHNNINIISRPQSGRNDNILQNQINLQRPNSDKKYNPEQKILINPIKIIEPPKNIIKLPQNNYVGHNQLQPNRNNFLNAIKVPDNKPNIGNNGPKIVYIHQNKKL